ncbi:LLM class flavin-dependent oxidoreductase [Microbacterium ulmi]|uniref:LLM class flavin-dependent oxidoreductase n=1 Tax=Microbacterium ulmi TaxID=179095 RepID=A0A7Y2M2X8_9MICO|nr:LLM class flavin-dependent oxidoreductase [Microbacterium ulmi]NII70529.1 alkanesulfonate monooxygenase SsuD/methylene tetrahydromethanopterin reductase-like flavin-dependent oxidoreductase (luciferase family) [Microbacterium ulmi]NNH05207.1 LLM class flavin-dependent oxidoreductase [Microbacterium ulmi]
MDYGRELEFGVSIDPTAADLAASRRLALVADRAGLDYLAVQDHPYQPSHLEVWTLLTHLASITERIGVTPDVLDLQLRLPSLVAKSAASFAEIAPGRVALGVGGGATPHGVEALGGTPHAGADMVRYTEEALAVLRRALAGGAVRLDTPRHRIAGYQAGPVPRPPVPVWLGSQKPRMLAVTGRAADGWISPLNIYVAPHEVPERQEAIDRAAREAGRDPRDIRRIYNVIGAIGPYAGANGLLGDVGVWIDTLSDWAVDLGFDTFVFWPMTDAERQVEVFASEVVPGIRERVAQRRKEAGR